MGGCAALCFCLFGAGASCVCGAVENWACEPFGVCPFMRGGCVNLKLQIEHSRSCVFWLASPIIHLSTPHSLLHRSPLPNSCKAQGHIAQVTTFEVWSVLTL